MLRSVVVIRKVETVTETVDDTEAIVIASVLRQQIHRSRWLQLIHDAIQSMAFFVHICGHKPTNSKMYCLDLVPSSEDER